MEDYYILKHSKNPIKRVIVPISYFTNWHYLYKAPILGEKLRTIEYETIYGIDYPLYLNLQEMVSLISQVSRSGQNASEIRFDYYGNVIGQCDSSICEINDSRTAFERHSKGKDFNQMHPYLDSIKTFCFNNRIDLYLVAMPNSHDYRKFTNEAGFDQYLKRINAKFNDDNCFFMDFREYFDVTQEKFMFRDADHLSFCGRSVFSKYLNEQIRLTLVKRSNL
jgi:hypothetical protein